MGTALLFARPAAHMEPQIAQFGIANIGMFC
jgi:hypothetical protein